MPSDKTWFQSLSTSAKSVIAGVTALGGAVAALDNYHLLPASFSALIHQHEAATEDAEEEAHGWTLTAGSDSEKSPDKDLQEPSASTIKQIIDDLPTTENEFVSLDRSDVESHYIRATANADETFELDYQEGEEDEQHSTQAKLTKAQVFSAFLKFYEEDGTFKDDQEFAVAAVEAADAK